MIRSEGKHSIFFLGGTFKPRSAFSKHLIQAIVFLLFVSFYHQGIECVATISF